MSAHGRNSRRCFAKLNNFAKRRKLALHERRLKKWRLSAMCGYCFAALRNAISAVSRPQKFTNFCGRPRPCKNSKNILPTSIIGHLKSLLDPPSPLVRDSVWSIFSELFSNEVFTRPRSTARSTMTSSGHLVSQRNSGRSRCRDSFKSAHDIRRRGISSKC